MRINKTSSYLLITAASLLFLLLATRHDVKQGVVSLSKYQ
jgi:hypothetical protein